jgi:signal transduction histidine kinase
MFWLHKNHGLNILAECKALRWGLWQCPPFLFIILGFVTIISIIATASIANIYFNDPEIPTIIATSIETALFLVLGNLIIGGFNKIAESNRLRAEFVSVVSHQLRSPLSIFKWTVDALEREFRTKSGENNANIEIFLSTMRDTNENMIHLVNSLLEVSRIEAGRFTLKEERFSLAELTEHAVDSFKKYAEASNIKIELEKDPKIGEIRSDRERISMVIQNLLDNAIRYSNGSGKIKIEVSGDQSQIRWSIKDGGIGIPPGQQKYIFQKFFRADSGRRSQTEGSGIGLYIAKAIVEASGGKIGFTSEENKGSMFWFTLPIK